MFNEIVESMELGVYHSSVCDLSHCPHQNLMPLAHSCCKFAANMQQVSATFCSKFFIVCKLVFKHTLCCKLAAYSSGTYFWPSVLQTSGIFPEHWGQLHVHVVLAAAVCHMQTYLWNCFFPFFYIPYVPISPCIIEFLIDIWMNIIVLLSLLNFPSVMVMHTSRINKFCIYTT